MTAILPKFAQLYGDYFIRNITAGETVLTPVFLATSGTFTPNIVMEDIMSTGNKRGVAHTYEKSRAAALKIVAKSRHEYLLMLSMFAKGVIVPASTAPIAFTFPAMRAGQAITVAGRNLRNVTIPGLVIDVDFEVLPKTGVIRALTENLAAIESATYEHGVFTQGGVFNETPQHFQIVYASEDAGQSYDFYEGVCTPSGDFNLTAESGPMGESSFEFRLLESSSAVADPELGKWGRVYNV